LSGRVNDELTAQHKAGRIPKSPRVGTTLPTLFLMQPIPVKVKNVSVYPYLGVSIGPVAEPIVTGAAGTYAIGTLGTSVFYNLDLSGGKYVGELGIHMQYIAKGEYDDGSPFISVWMYCLENSSKPRFGRTVYLRSEGGAPGAEISPGALSVPPYITLAPLSEITVSQLFPPPAIGQIVLIQKAKGNIIATKTGTPHEMGVEVSGGKRSGQLHLGMSRIIISGRTKDGHMYTAAGLTCVSAADPAIFFKLFQGE
jgi:hypothetical protein